MVKAATSRSSDGEARRNRLRPRFAAPHGFGQVHQPLELVVPVSLTRTDEEAQLHDVLAGYKLASDPAVRERHRLQVAALLLRFLTLHRSCIERMAGATIDTIAVVPSTRRPQGPHPLAEAIALTTLDRELAPLLTRGQGTATHLRADDTAFAAAGAARGRSVLLVDDTFTTGARMQSAASALTLAGARVVAGVPLGRVIDVSDPDRYLEKLALWRRQRAAGFSFDTCCLE